MPAANGNQDRNRRFLRNYSVATSFGIVLVAGILFGYYVGGYVDRWLGTGPWITLALMILAMISAFQNLVRGLSARNKDDT